MSGFYLGFLIPVNILYGISLYYIVNEMTNLHQRLVDNDENPPKRQKLAAALKYKSLHQLSAIECRQKAYVP